MLYSILCIIFISGVHVCTLLEGNFGGEFSGSLRIC